MDVSSIQSMMNQYVSQSADAKVESDSFLSVLEAATKKQDDVALKEACRDFESYFVKQMYTVMRKTVPEGTLTEKSHGREIFEDLLDEEYALEATKGRGMGIAEMLYKQLSKD